MYTSISFKHRESRNGCLLQIYDGPPLGMTLIRRLSNKLTTKILKSLTGYQITDSQCGFRAFSFDVAHYFLNIPYNDYAYESEIIYQASQKV